MKRSLGLVFRSALTAGSLLILGLHIQAPAAVSGTGRIHTLKLVVVDATTKQPVAGAQVVSWESRDISKAVTDGAGIAIVSVPVDIPHADQMQRFDVTVIDSRYAQRRVMWIATAGRVRE